MTADTHVLVIEDEQAIAWAIADRLRSEGFDVTVAFDGTTGVELCARRRPDLVVLDLMLPGIDGLEVCRMIQRDAPVPVLMLTARDDETDMLVGLGIGADDYMTKPFSPRELVARIRAILRRTAATAAAGDRDGQPVRIGDLCIDQASRRVWRTDVEAHLTATEFDLLWCLVERPGAVRTRPQLLSAVWGWSDEAAERTIDSHVRSIRRKLGRDTIRTVHSVGYAAGAADTELDNGRAATIGTGNGQVDA
ncbi:response regulator transcription factor [soil metagenome]